MLFRILNNSPNIIQALQVFLSVSAVLVLSLSVHEFAHAFIANKLGDPTAKRLGRLTLDPRAHLDPMGTVMLLLLGFGWGKPVPVNEGNLGEPKRDSALISLAGPVSNIIIAVLFIVIFQLASLNLNSVVGYIIGLTVTYNIILAVFNLIPVNPLDGFKVVNGILPRELSYQWMQIGRYGIWILLLLVFTGAIDRIIYPVIDFAFRLLQN